MAGHRPGDKAIIWINVGLDYWLKCNFLNENICIFIDISLNVIAKCPIDNTPPLVQIMAWSRIGDKTLSELMVAHFIDAYMHQLTSNSYLMGACQSRNLAALSFKSFFYNFPCG